MGASTTQEAMVNNLFNNFGQLFTDGVPILLLFIGFGVTLFLVGMIYKIIVGGIKSVGK